MHRKNIYINNKYEGAKKIDVLGKKRGAKKALPV